MRLFLIRHGETVDNVAQVYAGSRDSALTAHGVLQARRLATHLAQMPSSGAKVFSSGLQRAVKTAQAISDAHGQSETPQQLPQLREKDFGTGEGARFGAGKDHVHEGAESQDAMRARVDVFLQEHLLPLVSSTDHVFVVAHGIILGVLFRLLCEKLSRGALSVAPDAQRAATPHPSGGSTPLQPTWSNTGYLEAQLTAPGTTWSSVKLHVLRVNSVDHLHGLRKTRGGIGSARFDDKQKTLTSFFAPKKRKRADADD
jgi:2,3-bisphosphoglycerate-dependent phosphoglycerate mutase